MSSSGPLLIAPKVHDCVRRFNALCGSLPEADRTARPALVDQLGRLKIWAGNIGAFQELPLPSSLDYRLREAPKIVKQVIELLDDLNETLQEVSSIISGERPNRANTDGGTDDLISGNDGNDYNEDEASVLSDQSQPSSELEELLESSSDTITSLFKISVLVKSATTRDRYAKAAKAQGEPFDARFDISHVGHKFPRIHRTVWLERRLGKAITQRRQYLRYCRQHRDRLDAQHKVADVGENARDRQPTVVRKPVEEAQEATKSQNQSLKPPSTFAITTASTLLVNNFDSLEKPPDEVQSQTSYATSINEDESSDNLRVPPLPDEAVRGLPFECPYCWAPQLIKTRRAWKKHIFQDLKPYVCTFEECDLKMFADRSTWFSHEFQVHRVEWCCPFCTHSPLQSLILFENHLQKHHAQKFTKEQLSALGATCQQSVDKISPQACPFCDEWFVKLRDANPDHAGETLVVTPAQFQHHVGSHMEQLALFALPKDHGDVVESTGVAGGADNRSDSELGSKASYECHGNPPLHIAAYEGLEAEVFQLLEDGAKVNAPGQTWGNVLQAAVVGGHVSIVQLLLEYGAEVTLYGGAYGQYSLYTALRSGKKEIVRLLLEAREKTEFRSTEEVKRIYSDHEGEKQEALEIKENWDIGLDLETRYQIALRYPRAGYTCPVCDEKFGDANQLWLLHAAPRHQLSLNVMRPEDNTEIQKYLIISAERLSYSQDQTIERPQQVPGQEDSQKRSTMETSSSTEIGVTGGGDTVLLINSIIDISIQAKYEFESLLPDDLTLFSDVASVKSRLPRFIDILAKSELEAKAGRFSRRLPLERDLKLLLQNLRKSLEVLIDNLAAVSTVYPSAVSTAYPSGRVRIKPPGDSNGFEWTCIHSSASEVYVGMDLLDSTLRKFPVSSVQSSDSLETSQSNALQLADHADDTENTKDTEGAEDPEDPQDYEDPPGNPSDFEDLENPGDPRDHEEAPETPSDLEDLEDSEDPRNHGDPPEDPSDFEDLEVLEAEAFKGRILVDHIRFVIDKAIVINSRVQMVHRSAVSTSPDAITSIQQNLPQIINTLLKTQEQAEFGTYTIVVEAPVAILLDKLPPFLGNIERFFGSDEQRQARQSPYDPQAEEVQRISEKIETILIGLRKHESEVSTVSGMQEPLLSSLKPGADHIVDGTISRRDAKVTEARGDTDDASLNFEANQLSNNRSARISTEKVQDEGSSAPNPSFDLQSFGHGAPEGYQYQYSDCTGKRKALLISINSDGHILTLTHLMEDYGFELDNMIILSDKAKDDTHLPTKENILKGIRWLVGGAGTNDCLFFYYANPTLLFTHFEEDGSPYLFAFYPVDFEKAGLITSGDMHQIMIQPLRQGVRLTALFDVFCEKSPLKTPYNYSAEAQLDKADFSAKATSTLHTEFSSSTRTIQRPMTSASSSEQQSLPNDGFENLINATKTSPADVIVIYSYQHSSFLSYQGYSTASTFFQAHRYRRRESYAHILSRMQAEASSYPTISPRLSCSHPLDMQARFIM